MSRAKKVPSGGYPIGQRVRIVKASTKPYLLGRVGTVASALSRVSNRGGERWTGQRVFLDDFGPYVPVPGGEEIEFWPTPSSLEPIDDYDGRKVTSWGSCCWKPTVTA